MALKDVVLVVGFFIIIGLISQCGPEELAETPEDDESLVRQESVLVFVSTLFLLAILCKFFDWKSVLRRLKNSRLGRLLGMEDVPVSLREFRAGPSCGLPHPIWSRFWFTREAVLRVQASADSVRAKLKNRRAYYEWELRRYNNRS